ncbi:MAG TPA: hypothetical protein PL064_09390, partial [Thermogutta sp.]|nr:hypothetical protein [Thermogutta sp.]
MTRSNLVLGGLLIGLTLLAIFGCGRGSEPPPPPSPPPVAAPPPPPPQPQPQPKEEKKEELPEDLSTWTKDHFILARKKQDKKIFDALEQLIADATAGQRGEEAVSILRALLERPASPQPAGGPGGPYGSPMYGPGMASGMPEEGYSPEYGSPGPSPMPQPQAAQAKDPN